MFNGFCKKTKNGTIHRTVRFATKISIEKRFCGLYDTFRAF